MSYLRSKDKKCHNRRKENVVPMRRPKRAPSVCLDPILCEHGLVEPLPFRDDSKDRKQSWWNKLLRKVGL